MSIFGQSILGQYVLCVVCVVWVLCCGCCVVGVVSDFGQTDVGQFECFSVLAKFSGPKSPNLGEGADLSGFHPSGPTYSGFGVVVVMVVVVVVGLDFPGPPSARPLSFLRWTLPPPDSPKFRSFFPLPPPFRSFSVSLGVLS